MSSWKHELIFYRKSKTNILFMKTTIAISAKQNREIRLIERKLGRTP